MTPTIQAWIMTPTMDWIKKLQKVRKNWHIFYPLQKFPRLCMSNPVHLSVVELMIPDISPFSRQTYNRKVRIEITRRAEPGGAGSCGLSREGGLQSKHGHTMLLLCPGVSLHSLSHPRAYLARLYCCLCQTGKENTGFACVWQWPLISLLSGNIVLGGTFRHIFLNTHDDDSLGALLCRLPPAISNGVLGFNAEHKNKLKISQKYLHFKEKVKQKYSGVKQHLLLVRFQCL